MKASEMANEELAECIESARLAPAKYVREDELNFHREAIREAAARLRNLGKIGEEVGLEATREKSSQVGNAAKMREALVRAQRVLHCAIVAEILKGDDAQEALNVVTAALSAPPRNCDVGTVAEQGKRMNEFCNFHKHVGSVYACETCELFTVERCELAWSQMPYGEGAEDEGK